MGQAQLKLGLGFTPTNLHPIDEQETLKRPLAPSYYFSPQQSPNSHNWPYFAYFKLVHYYPGFGGGVGWQ